jgi:hypothetical protein
VESATPLRFRLIYAAQRPRRQPRGEVLDCGRWNRPTIGRGDLYRLIHKSFRVRENNQSTNQSAKRFFVGSIPTRASMV